MLHAFNQKKSRLYQRYLGHRDDPDEKRVAEEDEITSLIMGPLALLSPGAIAAFWDALLRLRNPEHSFPAQAPTRVTMQFWPRRHRIEPDLRVDLSWGTVSQILLVEFKWRAPLSSKDQLHDQWGIYLDDDERTRALHLFIGLDISEGLNAQNRKDDWHGKLIMRSWFDVLTAVSTIKAGAGLELHAWSEQVRSFLKLLAVQPFAGFDALTPPVLPALQDVLFFTSAQLTKTLDND
jgi:hypothetical protein